VGTSEGAGDDRPGFIVPPPGLIPARGPDDGGDARDADRPVGGAPSPLPSFLPPAVPGAVPPQPAPVWRLTAPGGARIPVTATVLLGRNPSAAVHPGPAALVVLDDPTSTVSKTHAAVRPAGDVLEITDLHSTNGVTVVSAGGAATRVPPGTTGRIGSGGRLLLGDLALLVERV
jgi:hypothetical protein